MEVVTRACSSSLIIVIGGDFFVYMPGGILCDILRETIL